jgi:hypothetical protein
MEIEKLSLDTLGQGASHEIFAHLLEQVVRNIADPNTNAEAERSLTLEFIFKPFPDRSGAQVEIRSKSKLQSVESVQTTVFMAHDAGRITAYAQDPRQMRMFASNDETKPQ